MRKIVMAVVMAGMTVSAYAAEFSDLAVKATDLKALAEAERGGAAGISKVYVQANAPQTGAAGTQVEWISINGGNFIMGSDDPGPAFSDARPSHEVAVKTFEMSKTAVTVEQYAECLIKGACTEPGTGGYCNWGKTGRQLHPVNCVDWDQAAQYAKFKGARLPSESEWEYAARSGGKDQKYPWGDDTPTCDRAVMTYGCGTDATMPVCSKPAGNTEQGLCDMAGNVLQWVQDKYLGSYKGVPADGSAFEGPGSLPRVMRGGSFDRNAAAYFRAIYRYQDSGSDNFRAGFRLARSH